MLFREVRARTFSIGDFEGSSGGGGMSVALGMLAEAEK